MLVFLLATSAYGAVYYVDGSLGGTARVGLEHLIV